MAGARNAFLAAEAAQYGAGVGNPFGQYPSHPLQSVGAVRRPRQVVVSSWFWFAAMALTFVPLPAFVLVSDVPQQAVHQGASAGIVPILRMLTGAVLTVLLVSEGVLAAIWLLFVLKMSAGRPWARIVLAVFGLATVMWSTLNALTNDPVWMRSVAMATALTEGVAIVLMFRPAAAEYFGR